MLYESGLAPRWYVPRADIVAEAVAPVELQTSCPYKGIASYLSIDEGGACGPWSRRPEVAR